MGDGGAYLKNRDKINRPYKYRRHKAFIGRSEGMLPSEKCEVYDPQIARNALKISILPSPLYFVSYLST